MSVRMDLLDQLFMSRSSSKAWVNQFTLAITEQHILVHQVLSEVEMNRDESSASSVREQKHGGVEGENNTADLCKLVRNIYLKQT